MNISAFFPAYNEEGNIEALIKSADSVLKGIAKKYEIIIVQYEGATDNTIPILNMLKNKFKHLKIVIQPTTKKGVGIAYKMGLEAARYEYVFYSDADNQFDLKEIKKLLRFVPKYDIAAGYRKHRKDPFGRILASKVYNIIVNILLGKTAKDLDCAFRLIKKEVIDNIDIKSKGGALTAELLIKAKRKGYKIKNVAVTHLPRKEGKSVFENKLPLPNFKTIKLQLKEIFRLRKEIKDGY